MTYLWVVVIPKMRVFYLLLLFSFFISSSSQIPTTGLIGAWPFSGNANDVSGSNNHGTVNGATLVADRCGVPNSAYSFNGTSDYIQTLAAGPTGSLSRSVCFWAKTSNTLVNSPRSCFDYGFNSGNGDSFQIVWNYCSGGVGLDVSNQALIKTNNCVLTNTWHHIAVVYNATTSTLYGNTSFYIDGVIQSPIVCSVSGTNAAVNTATNFPINIGKHCNGSGRFWSGTLDDFYLYNRAITATEVMQLYTYTTCPQPVVGSTLVCPGSTYIYSVAPVTNATYSWTLPGGWTGTSTSNTISLLAGTTSGTISATATSTCGILATYALAVNTLTLPLLNVTSTNSMLCNGTSVTLTATGANSYTLQPGGPFNNTISVTPTVTTNYTVSASGLNGCSTNTVFNQVVVNNATITSFVNPMLCNGSVATLSATGGSTYTWQPGNLTGSLITVSPSVSTVYTVVGFSSGNCSGSSIIMLPVPPPLTLNVAVSSPTACIGNSITFSAIASGGTAGYNYSWTGGPSSATAVVNPSVSGTYIYTVTSIDSNTCSITQTTSVDFIQVLNLTSSSVAICPTTTETLTISGANTYTWYPGGANGNTHTVSPASVSVYTVIGTSVSGCTASATKTVIIKSAPTLSFVTATITCGSLGSATVSASGTPGPFNFTWTPTSQTGSVATGLYPGTYTIAVYDAGTSCVFNPTTSFSPLIPLTGTVTATPSLACRSVNVGSASISLAGGSGNQTYLWSDVNGTQTTALATGLAAGINTVTVVDALTYCSVTHTFLITQPTSFTLNIASSSPSVCLGGSISYTATNSGGTPGYTYSWTNGPTGNLNTVTETSQGIYIYSVTSVDANTCSVTNTIAANFVPNPTISVSSTSICPLAIASITATGATSYTWNTGSTLNPLLVSPNSTTQYTVVGSTAGCTSTASGDVFLKTIPVISYTTNSPICQGNTLNLVATSTHSLYQWTGPLNFVSLTGTAAISPTSPLMNGNYVLKVTAANGCTASITQSVTIYPTPALTANSNTVCQGQTLNLSASYLQGGSYLWTGASFSSTLQNTTISNAFPAMTGSYTVKVTSVHGCTNIAVANASVIATPIAIINTSTDFCVGSSITLNGLGGGVYSWFGPNGFSSSLQNPVLQNVGLGSGGNYTLFVNVAGCYASTTKFITIHSLPVFTISSNSPVCENAQIDLSTNASLSIYLWTGPNGFNSSSQHPQLTATSMSYAGVYSLNAADVNGCVGSNFVNVEILPAPVLVANNVTVCLGGEATLSATANAVSYSWNGPQNYTGSLSSVYLPVVNPANTGVYTVTAVGLNSCASTSTLNVTGFSFALPSPFISGSNKACMNTTFTLQGSGGTTYQWAGPGNFNSTKKDVQIFINELNLAGIYTLTAKNESNCVSSSTIQVTVYPAPQGNLSVSNNNLCEPFCTELKFKELNNISPVIKTDFFVEKENLIDSIKAYCFTKSGYYTTKVNFMDSNSCTNTSTLVVIVNPKPNANFEYSPSAPIAGIDLVQFYNSSMGDGLGTWLWFLNGNNSINTWEKNPTFLYEASGKYPIVLIAENKWGCKDTVIKVLLVEDEFNLYVPNAFTPNSDGLNDVFQPKGQGISNYTLEIFDRWGEQIFQTNDFYTGWDGTYKGKNCKTDIYVWKITTTSTQKERKTKTGQLTLLRKELSEED
jgi:gliding motility-associated-like protein